MHSLRRSKIASRKIAQNLPNWLKRVIHCFCCRPCCSAATAAEQEWRASWRGYRHSHCPPHLFNSINRSKAVTTNCKDVPLIHWCPNDPDKCEKLHASTLETIVKSLFRRMSIKSTTLGSQLTQKVYPTCVRVGSFHPPSSFRTHRRNHSYHLRLPSL